MPAKYKRCVRKLMKKGYKESSAHAICTSRNVGNIKQYRKKEAKRRRKKRG